MSKTISIEVPDQIYDAFAVLAAKKGITVEQFCLTCLVLGTPKKLAKDLPRE